MKPFTMIATLVFALVAALQLVRVLEGWDVMIGSVHVPIWASLVAAAFAALLCVMVWRENRAAAPRAERAYSGALRRSSVTGKRGLRASLRTSIGPAVCPIAWKRAVRRASASSAFTGKVS